MLNAIYKHLYYLLSFNHNGEGLKTSKGFTYFLIAICFGISLFYYETVNAGVIILNLGALLFLYLISNKDIVNGVLIGMLLFLIVNLFFPKLSWLLFIWILLATSKMQKNYTDNNK